jgi:hypothetical protein
VRLDVLETLVDVALPVGLPVQDRCGLVGRSHQPLRLVRVRTRQQHGTSVAPHVDARAVAVAFGVVPLQPECDGGSVVERLHLDVVDALAARLHRGRRRLPFEFDENRAGLTPRARGRIVDGERAVDASGADSGADRRSAVTGRQECSACDPRAGQDAAGDDAAACRPGAS